MSKNFRKSKKIKPIVISTLIGILTLTGSSFAYSSNFSGTWDKGDTIDGSKNNKYYNLNAGTTKISATARVTNTNLGATERAFIEVRKKTSIGSSKVHYYTSGSYKNYININTSFKASKGKHYLILRKANRHVPGTISGTISQ